MKEKRVPRIARIAGALAAAFMAFSACSPQHEATYSPPPPTPTIGASRSGEILTKTNQQIIEQEVKRLGINYSVFEQQLWPIFHNDISSMTNEQKINEAQKRAATAIINMEKSENPYFQEVARDFKQFLRTDMLSIRLVPGPLIISSEKALAGMGTDIEIRNGKLHRLIVVDANLLLENPHLVEIALQFTHEIQHTKNSIGFEKSLSPSLSVNQKLYLELQRPRNQDNVVVEEADAHGVEAQAYIHAYGLGFYQKPKLQYQILAGVFIRSGANPESQAWKKAVAQEFLGIQNWQPEEN